MVNVTVLPENGLDGDAVTMMVGRGIGITVTDVEVGIVLPALSVNVAETVYVPGLVYTCATIWFPETTPRSCVWPSPQTTVTSRATAPLATLVTANVNDAGRPALGGVLGGVI